MFRTIVTTYLARFASMISIFLLLPIVLNAYGADAYGLYALVVSLAVLFQQDLGMGNATTRFVAVARAEGNVDRANRVAAASWAFGLITGLALAGVLVLVSIPVVGGMSGLSAELEAAAPALIALSAANLFIVILVSVNRQVLAGAGYLVDVNRLLIAQAVLRIALTLVVVWFGWGIVFVAVADLATTVLGGVATYAVRKLRIPELKLAVSAFSWTVFKEMFVVSAQLLIISIAGTLIMQAGSIITAVLLPVAFVAFYAAAQRLYQLVKEVTNSLSVAILPGASTAYAERGASANGVVYLQGTRLANMLMTLVLVPILAFLPLIVTLWLGADAMPAVLVAEILIASLFANNNHLLAVPILTAEGSVKGYAVLHSIWAVTGVTLAFVFGSWWGIAGIGLGIVLPIVLLEPLYIWIALRRQSLRTRDFLVQCLLSPFGTALLPAVALICYGRIVSPSLGAAILATAVWGAGMLLLYLFVGMGKELRTTLLRSLPFKKA